MSDRIGHGKVKQYKWGKKNNNNKIVVVILKPHNNNRFSSVVPTVFRSEISGFEMVFFLKNKTVEYSAGSNSTVGVLRGMTIK